tara:strand:+ start:2101 stop:2499 length:399 start_codon:yes stop_codon:yes gene_type:complete
MTQNLPATMDDVPASLVDIAETFGFPVVLKLIQHFGGTELKFPKKPGDDHPVVKALGPELGPAVSHFLTGVTIYIPHARTSSARKDILNLEKKGLTRSEIARELKISQRHVRRMANSKGRKNPNQIEMFPED